MELYKALAALRCFRRGELVQITGSENSADWHIRDFLKKGYIERVRRDLYAVISLETGQAIPNRFQIATHCAEDAHIVCHSAFEYYGYANQVFYDVYFSSSGKIRSFEYDGISYHPGLTRNSSVEVNENQGIRATSVEQTVIDSIDDTKKAGGLEELLRCLILIPSLDEDKLLQALEGHGKVKLYQKAGVILEAFRDELHLSDSFFEECEKNISVNKSYFAERQQDFVYYKRWGMYAPENLKSYIDKGVSDYDAV